MEQVYTTGAQVDMNTWNVYVTDDFGFLVEVGFSWSGCVPPQSGRGYVITAESITRRKDVGTPWHQ